MFNNKLFSMNLFRWVHVASYQCRRLLVRHLLGGAPVVRRFCTGKPSLKRLVASTADAQAVPT
jgi:hypothetical protein